MAIRIRKYKKPTLSLSLAAGGSLPIGTIYMTGLFYGDYSVPRSGSGASPAADRVSIVTDAANRTVVVNWRTVGNITAFADAGGGKVNVTCEDHCLGGGETITIQNTTNYNDDYEITWIDYDTFQITETWAGDDAAGDWYCEELPNNAEGITLYANDAEIYSGGAWVVGNYYSHDNYDQGYTTNNINYTALLTETSNSRFLPDLTPSEIEDYLSDGVDGSIGRIQVEIDGGTHDLEDVHDAIVAAHATAAANFSKYNGTLLGSIVVKSAAAIDFSKCVLIILIGSIDDPYGSIDMEYTDVNFQQNYQIILQVNLDKSNIRSNFHLTVTDCDFSEENLISAYQISSYLNSGGSAENLQLLVETRTWVIFARTDDYWRNITQSGGYLWIWRYGGLGDPTTRVFENYQVNDGSYDYDYYIYQYSGDSTVVPLYNCTSNRAGGVAVRLYTRGDDGLTVPFYFNVKLKITAGGAAYASKDVIVTPISGSPETFTTDVNGEIDEWVKSYDFQQLTKKTYVILTEPSHEFGPFTITINGGNDYQDYTSDEFDLTENIDWEIALQAKVTQIVTRVTTFQNTNIAQTISLIEGGQQVLAAYQELIIEEDVDFEQSFQWLDGNGNYIPLNTDSNIDFVFGISYRNEEDTPLLSKRYTVDSNIFTVGAQGIVTVSIPRALLNAINFNRAYYSFKCYYMSKWYRLIEGPILLSTEAALID